MVVPPSISFIFFYQIQVCQLPLAMLWKRETTRIWGEKLDRKTFTIICEVKLNDNWWHYSSTMRYRVPFLKGIKKQTNSIQASDTRVCQWFYNSRSNDQKRLQWAVFYGSSAAWCLYRPDTPRSFLAFKRNDYRNAIGEWGETWDIQL